LESVVFGAGVDKRGDSTDFSVFSDFANVEGIEVADLGGSLFEECDGFKFFNELVGEDFEAAFVEHGALGFEDEGVVNFHVCRVGK